MTSLLEQIYALPEPELLNSLQLLEFLEQPSEIKVSIDDIPELTEIADSKHLPSNPTEKDFDIIIHAYRLLASLKTPSTIDTFFKLYNVAHEAQDDIYLEDFITIISLFGDHAIPKLFAKLEKIDIEDQTKQLCYVEALEKCHLTASDKNKLRIIEFSMQHLNLEHQDRELNALYCSLLISIKHLPAISLIENLHTKNLIDVSINGDIEEVKVAIGYITERSFPAPNFQELEERQLFQFKKSQLTEPSVTDTSTAHLDFYLRLLGGDTSLPNASALDGFLVACCITQKIPTVNQFTPWIWNSMDGSSYSPQWDTPTRQDSFNEQLMDHHLETHELLIDHEYEPVTIISEGSDAEIYAMWEYGFHVGLKVTDAQNDFDHIFNILDKLVDEPLNPHKGIGKSVKHTKLRNQLCKRLASDYAKPRDQQSTSMNQPHSTVSTGRNDPCPCKSGKKYKKCCLNQHN